MYKPFHFRSSRI